MNLLFAFLPERKIKTAALDKLERRIGKVRWQKLFPEVIKDNSIELQNPDYLENSMFSFLERF